MDLVTALRTTGAVRAFSAEPVTDDVVHAVLDAARFAPSGGNRQPWRVAVVRDLTIRRAIADLMQPVWDEYSGAKAAGAVPFAFGRSIDAPPVPTPSPLIDEIDTIPVVLAVAADLREVALMDGLLDRPSISAGASVYPFCWSILLAAHEYGLGGVMTTFLSRVEPAAAPLLQLPADHALAATIFLGVPAQRATKLRRSAVSEFATADHFGGPSLT